jgi:hypothetical protein
MRTTYYCPNNVLCLDKRCKKPHYKTFTERMKLNDLYLEAKEEMDTYMEPFKEDTATCRYHLLCFERECIYNHSCYALNGRKILIKKFKTFMKSEKAKVKSEVVEDTIPVVEPEVVDDIRNRVKMEIEADIQNIRNGVKMSWADM